MHKRGLFGMNGLMVGLLTSLSVAVHAQETGNLILIDAEDRQAFTVRIGDQLYASSGHGHLLLSHLKEGMYLLNMRFPKKNIAEQVFPVTVQQKDLGFQIKSADSSCVLYNWQTKETIVPVMERDSSRILDRGVKREDSFSRLMAAVVNDSSVMYNTYNGIGLGKDSTDRGLPPTANRQPPTANRQPLTANRQPLTANRQPPTAFSSVESGKNAGKDSLLEIKRVSSSKDSLLALNGQPPTAPAGRDQPQAAPADVLLTKPVNQRPSSVVQGIKKLREVSLKISRKMVFLDVGKDGQADTITLFVYFESNDTLLKKQVPGEPLAVKKPSDTDSSAMNSNLAAKKPSHPDTTAMIRIQDRKKSGIQACSQPATDEDVESLRSTIIGANTEQEKIAMAVGAFALKCFSVSQIRILAGLFVSDKDRYRLMEAARLHITDYDHFPELVDMLTDKDFKRKFLSMAENRL